MAKNPSLTVNVKDEQFKAFVKSFTELSVKMQSMTQQWKSLSQQIDKTAASTNNITAAAKTAGQYLLSAANTSAKITKHLTRWGGIIGGIVTMLGGGTMFGMDRIAQRMLDTRRRLLGLGGADYGKTQAIETFGKGLLDDPKGALSNIAKAKSDITSDQYLALLVKGISPKDIQTKKAPELLMEFLKRTSKERMEGPFTLPHAQSFKETAIVSEQDAVRLHGKEGKDLVDMLGKRFDAAKGLTDADLKIWEKFWESVTNFKTKLDVEWIKALEPLAPAGSKLIEALTNLTTAFLRFSVVVGYIEGIAKGMEWLAKFMEQPSWKEAWEGLKGLLNSLVKLPKGSEGYQQKYQEKMGITPPGAPAKPSVYDWLSGKLTGAAPAAEGGASFSDRFGNWTSRGGAAASFKGVGPASSFIPTAPGVTSRDRFPAAIQQMAPGPRAPSGGDGGGFKFSSAVGRMAPATGGASSAMMNFAQNFVSGQGKGGPLDSDNWQSSRTSSLVVRGVPGSNLFLTAAGMTG